MFRGICIWLFTVKVYNVSEDEEKGEENGHGDHKGETGNGDLFYLKLISPH